MAEEKKKTLAETLDAITFKNKQISDITNLQNENARLKDMIGSKARKRSSAPSISGLETLKNTLGKQFSK